MPQDAPIYDQLIAKLGDIPTQVRSESERTVRILEQVMQSGVPSPELDVADYAPATVA